MDLDFERVELPDGDFLDLAWAGTNIGKIVLVLHGLEGSHLSAYAQTILAALHRSGYRAVLMNFRGCSGLPNRLDRSYHSGDTADAAYIAKHIEQRTGQALFAAIGYSLGGNVLLKWLGESGTSLPLTTAAAISVPFDLAACATRLNQGFSRFYQWWLLRSMKKKYRKKFISRRSPVKIRDIDKLTTFWTYDNKVTAPLHGFNDVHDYYTASSSRQYLHKITVPTLILHAENDPFVPRSAIPTAQELSPQTTIELCQSGGHVGFVCRSHLGKDCRWLEKRIIRHLDDASS